MYCVTELIAGVDGACGEPCRAGGAAWRKTLSARAYGLNVF